MAEKSVEVEADEEDLRDVIDGEDRLRELREEKLRQEREIDAADDDVENPPTVQRGIVRDVEKKDGYRERLVLTVETEYDVLDVEMRLPDDEYSLENDLVMLLEWKGITDGQFSELLEEAVYVDTEAQEIRTPGSLSPFARAWVHVSSRGAKYMPEFGDEGGYLTAALVATFMHFLFLPLYVYLGNAFGGAGLLFSFVFMFGWSFFLGPLVLGMLKTPVLNWYQRAKRFWKRRYHEV